MRHITEIIDGLARRGAEVRNTQPRRLADVARSLHDDHIGIIDIDDSRMLDHIIAVGNLLTDDHVLAVKIVNVERIGTSGKGRRRPPYTTNRDNTGNARQPQTADHAAIDMLHSSCVHFLTPFHGRCGTIALRLTPKGQSCLGQGTVAFAVKTRQGSNFRTAC